MGDNRKDAVEEEPRMPRGEINIRKTSENIRGDHKVDLSELN